ncbi:response regulator transcription factor [uncultured Duncaniella sp.]|uniref:response regulator transcription factor n=1 Tax=uncultured Duncaniella sp. TaxID=2768039 RepID=UPI0025D73157|nr:helix-turn-helix transcriptional regulator [uncultured Duncaniella sp.]
MLEKTEFYNCPDGSINVKPYDKPMFVYDQSCRKVTEEMLILIRDLYPGAFTALSELYSRSERNREFFEFRIVHRFIRCNFGEYDALSYDINGVGEFNFEDVRCPMRGECLFEGEICKPVLQTRLSAREQEVAELLSEGLCPAEIGEELQISIMTVRNHIQHIKARLHLKNTSQIVARFKKQV